MGQARPGGGIGLLNSPTGSSLPLFPKAATKQITAKATGTMLVNGHKRHQTSVGLSLPVPLRAHYARTNNQTQVPCTSHRTAGFCERWLVFLHLLQLGEDVADEDIGFDAQGNTLVVI